jgi:two-component system nitrogen regulation response regulator GlnG
LFLDEIGDMLPAVQAKILRVLQEQRFERLGSNESVQTRVRVLAATNHDLEKAAAEGRFRKDLYYRLKGITIRVPPLRERRDDIAELAHYFLVQFNTELGRDLRSFAPETLEALQAHSWPGNVRELQSTIREAMLNATGQMILPEFLPTELRQGSPSAERRGLDVSELIEASLRSKEGNLYPRVLEAVERVLLPRVLQHTQGHLTQASELLAMSRGTLRQKLRNLGFAIDKVCTEE